MPETGELVNNEKWLADKIRQFIFYITMECDQPLHASEIERSVEVNDYNDYDHKNPRRLGVEAVIKTKGWPEEVKNKVVDALMQIRFPFVDIKEGSHHPSHWHIQADITKPDAQLFYPNGLVTPLVRDLNAYFDTLNYDLGATSILPKRIDQLAQKIPGARASKIAVEAAPPDEHFSHRVTLKAADISDPLWQRLAKALILLQRNQICGDDLRWHNPFEFSYKKGETLPISISGPLVAVRNAIDSVTTDIAPNLGSLNIKRQLA